MAEYVSKGVDLVSERLPEVAYPEALPSPFEVLDTQVDFAKKLLDAQAGVSRAVLEARLAPESLATQKPREAAPPRQPAQVA